MFRSATLSAAFAVAVFAFVRPSVAAPEDPDATEVAAIAAIEKLKGNPEVAIDTKLDSVARVSVKMDAATDATLISLGKIPSVGSIAILNGTKCTMKGIAALQELPDLQKLNIGRSTLADQSAEAIGKIKTLQMLYLGESKVTDIGVAAFKNLTDLRELDLYDTRVTDKGLAHLAELTKLEDLNLSGTKVTDEGVLQLKELKKLRTLRLVRTNTTRKSADELEKAIPKLVVRQ